MVVAFILLVFRNQGLYPTVFSDEYSYSKYARLIPFRDAGVPNYLYFKLFSYTTLCGDGFQNCSKFFNAILFIASAPFVYITACRVTKKSLALYLTVLTLLSPVSLYTAFFMPESFYYLGFWIFSCYILSLDSESKKREWLFAGALFGLSSLIKPHSLLFLPAIFCYVCILALPSRNWRRLTANVLSFLFILIGIFTAKFILSYNLAGSAGLTFFGRTYNSMATNAGDRAERFFQLVTSAMESGKGHVLVLALIYGLPLVLVSLTGARVLIQTRPTTPLERTSLFTLLVISNLVCVVALFTASVAGRPSETITRLHMRYYSFALPLLTIVAAGYLYRPSYNFRKVTQYTVGLLFMALVAYAYHTRLIPYIPGYLDSPEFGGLYTNREIFNTISLFSLFAIIGWLVFKELGLKIYLFFVFPCALLVSSFYVNKEIRKQLKPDMYDKAGMFARNFLSPDDMKKLVVVGTEDGGLTRTLFYIDTGTDHMEIIPKGAPYDPAKMREGKEWALVIGDHPIPEDTFYRVQMDGFLLAKGKRPESIDFRLESWPGLIDRVEGLFHPESWGAWSHQGIVKVDFTKPLPKKFNMILRARSFLPNLKKEFIVTLGDKVVPFALHHTSEEVLTLAFENPDQLKTIRFQNPSPIPEEELDKMESWKRLGLGLIDIKIVPL